MNPSNVKAYALFVDQEFKCLMYYPSEGSDDFIRITAGLKSNPRIILNEANQISNINDYYIFVEDDYVGNLFLLKENIQYDMNNLHNALQNNPTVVWIDSDTLPKPNSKWSYINNILTLIEE
jgi:hypothetical protein